MTFAVEVITLVPELWPAMLGPYTGLVGRAFTSGLAELRVRNLRDYGKGVHQQVDDSPFGGGAGMVLGVEPLHRAIVDAKARTQGPVVMLSPRGAPFCQAQARNWAHGSGLTLICGRYEGIDERVRRYVDADVSLGDFVLSAGDPAAFCMVDAVVRLLPGVLGNPESLHEESFAAGMLEYPQYTRPAEYEGAEVPAILRSGDHGAIAAWRRKMAQQLTQEHRPDLVGTGQKP